MGMGMGMDIKNLLDKKMYEGKLEIEQKV